MESLLAQAAKLSNTKRVSSGNNLAEFVNPEEPANDYILEFVEDIEKNHIPKWIFTFEDLRQWNEIHQNTANETMETTPEGEPIEPPFMDGQCIIKVSSDAITAWMMILPPIGKGVAVSPTQVSEQLAAQGIVTGIDAVACVNACMEYFTAFTIAKGSAPIHGTDGNVEELFPREVSKSLHITDHDTVDYRDLGWIQTVKTGDVICKITPAVAGIPGETVTGKAIPAKNGEMPHVPAGTNIKYSADKTRLIAQCEGRLVFSNNAFSVETRLTIDGDVDGNVGNIIMPGDVVIKGNVLSGFTVYAKGNLSVAGIVENAYLSAQGDISINIGVKSDGAAVIESNKNIDCKFVENATLRAKGSITAEYIVNSNISALRDIDITHGKGALVGGSVRVGHKISAKTIGNSSNRAITISMGMDPEILQELQQNQKELDQLESKVAEATKNISFLEQQESLDPEYKKLLQQLKFQRSIDNMHIGKLQKVIEKANESFDSEACEIESQVFYPPATIHIGSSTYHSQKTWNCQKVVFRDGNISVIPR